MRIELLKIKRDYRYLWLKTVEDVNLNVHCARCLVGSYDNRVNAVSKEFKDLELNEEKIYYLCGVSKPYKWENNFHLAFKKKDGSNIKIYSNDLELLVKDAEQIPITSEWVDKHHPKVGKKEYCTCRNWQFAHWFKKNMKSTEDDQPESRATGG